MTELTSISQKLKQLKPELTEKYHVSSIGLFGSIVRDDFSASSDVDIIADFSQPIGIEFVDLANYIAEINFWRMGNDGLWVIVRYCQVWSGMVRCCFLFT